MKFKNLFKHNKTNEKIISIYAPVDGVVYPIEKSKDDVFAQKMLGDGIFIEPIGSSFVSPFEKAQVDWIAPTGHAYVFIVDNIKFMMHIGVDTVELKELGLTPKIAKGQQIKLNDPIIDIDFNKVKEFEKKNNKKINLDTPIILMGKEITNYKFNILNDKKAEQGSKIAELTIGK